MNVSDGNVVGNSVDSPGRRNLLHVNAAQFFLDGRALNHINAYPPSAQLVRPPNDSALVPFILASMHQAMYTTAVVGSKTPPNIFHTDVFARKVPENTDASVIGINFNAPSVF